LILLDFLSWAWEFRGWEHTQKVFFFIYNPYTSYTHLIRFARIPFIYNGREGISKKKRDAYGHLGRGGERRDKEIGLDIYFKPFNNHTKFSFLNTLFLMLM
jgi:hypothetical protein